MNAGAGHLTPNHSRADVAGADCRGKAPAKWGKNMADSYKFILYRAADGIARITLNVPERRNALSFLMRDEIVRALRVAETDDEVSVVLIDGAGPSFCSGYDMSPGNRDNPKEGWVHSAHFDSWTDQFARSCLRDWMTIWDLLKPVVVKAHGHCVAGGTEILSMADIAFVADDARIG
jgi:enoyl-CoA hydratase